ncbi:O-methyltransferase family 3 protein [Infundibulicybe gibba]|nr:O-methyltransferase family 3 protein [Infundibulicybe gibba]
MQRPVFQPTSLEDWSRSDHYHNSFLIPPDGIMDQVLANCAAHGLPDIAVSTTQGKFLKLLAASINAKRVLEVGTLGGYSTIWLARALPEDGELLTLELSEEHARVARENIHLAGLESKAKIIVGPAINTLTQLQPDVPFDFVFIDADKPSNLNTLLKPNFVDNVVRYGRVADPSYSDSNVEGVRTLLKAIQNDLDVDATTIATTGEKGYDGFLYAIRK